MSEGSALVSPGNDTLPFFSLEHCVINLAKPKGITSHQTVERVRRIWGIRRVGHAGTLDPMATGVLLVCTGEATKVTRFLSDLEKEYVAVLKLGEKTDTQDAEGRVTEKTTGFSLTEDDVERILPRFIGTIEQVPPMYSAIKMDGKPLYKLARKGVIVKRKGRLVTINNIEITAFDLPFLELRIACAKGTYIRSLCSDIGEALGVGAHITGLVRTRIGQFSTTDSVALDGLEQFVAAHGSGGIPVPGLSSIDKALSHLGEVTLGEGEFSKARNGVPVRVFGEQFPSSGYVRIKDPSGKLFAIGECSKGIIKIERMLHL